MKSNLIIFIILIFGQTCLNQEVKISPLKIDLNETVVVDLLDGFLNGLKLTNDKDVLKKCVSSIHELIQIKNTNFSNIIYWQENPVKDIPEINNTLIGNLVDSIFDNSTSIVRQCGLISNKTFQYLRVVVPILLTEQGQKDILDRFNKNKVIILLYGSLALTSFKTGKFYSAGFQLGNAAKILLPPTLQNIHALSKKNVDFSMIRIKLINLLKRLNVSSVLIDILKGILDGSLVYNLDIARDSVQCVKLEVKAKDFFKTLSPQNVSTIEGLANTIQETKGVISPLVYTCLQSSDDLLVLINQAILLVTHWNNHNFIDVLFDNQQSIIDHIKNIIAFFKQGDVKDLTSDLTLMIEQFIQQIYERDLQQ